MASTLEFAGPYLRTDHLKIRGIAQSDVTLSLSAGSKVGIYGLDAVQNTQLLRALARLDPLAGGHLFWNGRDVSRKPFWRRRSHRRYVSLLLDNPYAYFDPAVRVRSLLRQLQVGDAQVQQLLQHGHVPPVILDSVVGDLSGLMRMRLALLRVQLNHSPVVLVDDVFSHLVPEVWETAMQAVTGVVGATQALLVASRYPACLQAMDTVYVLKNGRLTQDR